MNDITILQEELWNQKARWCPFCGDCSTPTKEEGLYKATCDNCGIETLKYFNFDGLLTYWNGEEK